MSTVECSEIGELLSSYFDQQLDGDDEKRVARHLEVCASCSEDLASIQNLSQLASELDDVPAPSRWSELASQLDEPHVGRASVVEDGTRRRARGPPRDQGAHVGATRPRV